MGARTNPTFGFIYPAKAKLHPFTPDPMLGTSIRLASVDPKSWDKDRTADALVARRDTPTPAYARASTPTGAKSPLLTTDPFIVEYADSSPSQRTLSAIIADVKRETRLN